MLTGQQQPVPLWAHLVHGIIHLAFFLPWILIGAGLLLVGLLAIGPRQDIAELWIGIPAGLALLAFIGCFLYQEFWRVPSLTVKRFTLEADKLELQTSAHGIINQSTEKICEIREERGRLGRGLLGWWIRFENQELVYLDRSMPSAGCLMGKLKALISW